MGHIDPTRQAFAAFRENDREGPIHMLNLVRLHAQARYPDGRQATGAEAYAAYGRESRPVFSRVGGRNGGRDVAWKLSLRRGSVRDRRKSVRAAQLPLLDVPQGPRRGLSQPGES